VEKDDRSSKEYKKNDPAVLSKKEIAVRTRPSMIINRASGTKILFNESLYNYAINYLSIHDCHICMDTK
jgi:hypothetical protein